MRHLAAQIEITGLKTQLELDTKPFKEAMEEARTTGEKEAERLGEAFSEAVTEGADFGRVGDTISQGAQRLGDSLSDAAEKAKEKEAERLGEAFSEAVTEGADFGRVGDTISQGAQRLGDSLSDAAEKAKGLGGIGETLDRDVIPKFSESGEAAKNWQDVVSEAAKAGADEMEKFNKKMESIQSVGEKISGVGTKLTFGVTVPVIAAGTAIGKAGADEMEKFNKKMESIQSVGEKISGVGTKLTFGVTVPVIAAGTAIGKMTIDAENDLGKMQGQLGLTSKEAEDLQEIAKGIYENGFGDSLSQCYQELTVMKQNLSSVNDLSLESQQSILEQILTMNDLFDTSTDEITRTLQVMTESGLIETAQEGLDIITYGFQNGANYSGELLDTLQEYSPKFQQLGLDAKGAMAYLIQGAENGAFNLDKVGDAMKEFSIRVVDGSDDTASAFQELGLASQDMSGEIEKAREKAESYSDKIRDLSDKLQLAQIKQSEFNDKTSESTKISMDQTIRKYNEQLEEARIGLEETTASLESMEAEMNSGKESVDDYASRFAQGGETAKEAFKETLNALKSVEDPLERQKIGVKLFGTMWEDMGEEAILSLADVEGGLEGVEGATERAGQQINNSFSTRMKMQFREVTDSLLPLGEEMLRLADECMPDVKEMIGEVTDFLKSMDDEMLENTLKWGGIVAAAGPALKLLGGGISTVSSLARAFGGVSSVLGVAGSAGAVGGTGVLGCLSALGPVALPAAGAVAAVGAAAYGVHEYGELMNSTAIRSRDEMSLMEKVMADLNGVTTYTKEELEEMGYIHKDFSENISPEFQQAVKDGTKELQNFDLYLNEIGFDDVLTEEESQEFNAKVDGICQGAIDTINAKKDEVQTAMEEMFESNGILTQAEQTTLEFLGRYYEDNTTKIQETKDEIKRIKTEALEEGRALNQQEITDINTHLETIKQLELESIGGTQEEMLYAQNEFANRVSTLTLEDASQLLQDKAAQRDEEIIQIKSSYDTQIQMLQSKLYETSGEERRALLESIGENIKARDEKIQLQNDIKSSYDTQIQMLQSKLYETSGEERRALLESIGENIKARDEKIQLQNDIYNSYLEIIKEKNPEMAAEINKYNGELLTNQEKDNQDRFRQELERWDGINEIQESGIYRMRDKEKGWYRDMAVIVDEATGEIVSMYNATEGEVYGYCESMCESAERLASESEDSYERIGLAIASYVDESGNLRNENDEVVGSFGEVTREADGTASKLVEIDGRTYKVTIDAGNAVTGLQQVKREADSIPREISITTRFHSSAPPNAMLKYNGIDRVPYDGYRAILHKDEAVLTKEQADILRNVDTQSSAPPNAMLKYNGIDRVPYDGYRAILHKDEAVLTKEQADILRNVDTQSTVINFNGNYNFQNQNDIKYFMNRAALMIKGAQS